MGVCLPIFNWHKEFFIASTVGGEWISNADAMLKHSMRRYSIKSLPYDPIPVNKYNSKRSAFNFKPVVRQGLVHNPPPSIISPQIKTPKAFLPANDPRAVKMADTYTKYTKEQLEDYPVIYGYANEKDYNLTPEMVAEINHLRQEDPKTWTISVLAKKFNVDQKKVNVITSINAERRAQIKEDLDRTQDAWPEQKRKARVDRRKRVQMWLRNEF